LSSPNYPARAGSWPEPWLRALGVGRWALPFGLCVAPD
jgi:hypothetical protein